ncbi:MAG: flagellar biosynthetic protein FliR [Leptolinea sp.]|nr:flagellar biosynthetic protein FliR [Leptolinea sp.]
MIISIAQTQIFVLALTRILAILVQVPIFGSEVIPNQVKVGLGVILAMIVIPWNPLPAESMYIPWLAFAGLVMRELIIGFLAGFAATLTFGAFQITGKLIDMSSGFGAGQVFNPAMSGAGGTLDQFFYLVVMLYFMLTNGHHLFLLGLRDTFVLLPMNQPLPEMNPEALLQLASGLIIAGVQMAIPVVGALFLTDLTLGLLAKVSPQINVFFLGLPIKVWVGIYALSLLFGLLVPSLDRAFKNLGPRMLQIMGA